MSPQRNGQNVNVNELNDLWIARKMCTHFFITIHLLIEILLTALKSLLNVCLSANVGNSNSRSAINFTELIIAFWLHSDGELWTFLKVGYGTILFQSIYLHGKFLYCERSKTRRLNNKSSINIVHLCIFTQ